MRKSVCEIYPNPPEGVDPSRLDFARIPRHVAIIMDGNGRWAKKRALNRLKGHKAGIEAVRETIRAASDTGVQFLTIYSFSTENWKRPADEVQGLMELFANTMLAEVDELHVEGVRVKTIGDLSALPSETREAFDTAWEKTKDNSGMTLVVALNYGARQEIVRAAQALVDKRVCEVGQSEELAGTAQACEVGQAGTSSPITEDEFAAALYTQGIPDPELLIRTSGERRLSNFLLWQLAYTELVVSDVLWPDFDRYEFLRALLDYQQRERRYGAV